MNLKVLGLTATPTRTDKKDLDFENEANFEDAIEVSAYKEEGIDFFKDKLLETIL